MHVGKQLRLRHIKAVVGRNLGFTGSVEADGSDGGVSGDEGAIESVTPLSGQSSPCLSAGGGTPKASLSVTPTLTTVDGSPPVHRALLSPADDGGDGSTMMKRSESTSSLHSIGDSSMTKSAYTSRQHKHHQQHHDHLDHKKELMERAAHDCKTKSLLDTYFSLAVLPHADAPFFVSNIIPNTTNPRFPTDTACAHNWYDGVQTCLVVKLYARHAAPAAPQPSQSLPFCLLIQWSIDMNELIFIGKSLDDVFSWPANTLAFELDHGFYTSPDIAASILGADHALRNRHVSHALDAIPSPRTKRSYTYHHVMRLNTLKDCVFDAQRSADEVQKSINDILEANASKMRLARECSQIDARQRALDDLIQAKQHEIDNGQHKLFQLRQRLADRRDALAQSRARFQQEQLDLESNEAQLDKNIRMHYDTQVQLTQRRKELIADLFSIYPIEQSFDDFQQFRIRGLYLPNSVYTGCDEDVVATALGFTAHLVAMLAFYLAIPLRYPIHPMGSRASVHDPVSMIHGSRTFPLYSKGVDKYRFEFGVFLLNKNIEQMMNAYGLIVLDLRHTLPNIHYFIQAVLTTSMDTGPTSLSVLSISSFAQGRDRPSIDFTRSEQDHATSKSEAHAEQLLHDHAPGEHHMTLNTRTAAMAMQVPVPSPVSRVAPRPSPTVSTQSTSQTPINPNNKLGASPSHVYGVHLASQVSAAPAVVDTVTTSSCQKPYSLKYTAKLEKSPTSF
ncbi:UV radiation resistance protein and autophagy-related subunit 14-domain-containing protein [Gongronella butleri]|nr:UV radiation resistance protein and autophagy-related subunit 14-domain-containing protein [Gongronella butleri]